ncbi:MAG: hypothetical protein ONB24_12980 [candidate division KSB1 bacterium]|nr:hypothetical protein [candidate division KSB1 bacterium]
MPQRTMSWSIMFLLAALESVFSGTATKQFSRNVDFNGDCVKVRTINGSIVVDTYDEKAVLIDADIRVRAASRANAERYLKKVNLLIEKSGNDLLIGIEPMSMRPFGFFERLFGGAAELQVDFYIKVPKDKAVQAETVNGTVNIDGMERRLVMKTVNGSLSAVGCKASVRAETTNGSIYLELSKLLPSDKVSLGTVNGGITLVIPKTTAADIRISTVNGKVKTDLPLEVVDGWSEGKLRGRINGGGAFIEAETVNGNVAVKSR